jgi:hypothetical protein
MPSKYVSRQCQRCEKGFQTTQSEVNKGKGRFCSNTCAAYTRQEMTGVMKCSRCGALRSITARKVDGMCRSCSAKSWGKHGRHANAMPFGRATIPSRPWAFASDSRDAQAERAMTWTESDDRPRVANTIRQGTVTQYGKVAAAGLNEHGLYYMVIDDKGQISQMPADVLERHGEAQKVAS